MNVECSLCGREVPEADAVLVEEDGEVLAYCSDECAEEARAGSSAEEEEARREEGLRGRA
jgi:ribosomal protein L24E